MGSGAKGNEGVAGQVKQTDGAIGYTELAYAKQNHLATAAVANQAGEYVEPSIESATAAAAGIAAKLPPTTDFRISIVNAPGSGAYPISSFTWLLVPKSISSAKKHKLLTDFLRWYLTKGETSAASLDYSPLPQPLIAMLTARVDSISAGNAP